MIEHIQGVIAVLIPVVAIIGGIAAAMFGMYVDFLKKRELMQNYHAERMAAIEKGVELPPLPESLVHVARSDWRGRTFSARGRRAGLILLFLGVAISLAHWGRNGGFWMGGGIWSGVILIGLGIAFLLSAFFDARDQRRKDAEGRSGQDSFPPPGR